MVVAQEPAPQLRPYVRQYYGFREATGAATRRHEGPGAEVVVILSFGLAWRIGAANPGRPPVTGGDAELLAEHLATERTWPDRFRLLETLLARRLSDSSTPTPGVAWAWRRLAETSGRVPIGALVEELGWSPKRLVARFRCT